MTETELAEYVIKWNSRDLMLIEIVMCAEGIIVMVVLDQHTLPVHLYFITNPLYADVMESQYNFHPRQIP